MVRREYRRASTCPRDLIDLVSMKPAHQPDHGTRRTTAAGEPRRSTEPEPQDVLQLSKSGKRAIGRVGRAPSHPGFPFCRPLMAPLLHPRSAEPTRLFLSHHRPGSEAVTQPALTCRGLEARASKGFLRHRSSLVSSPCQAGVLARAARQPAGTGSAQIRWSIAPNRRRVR